MFFRLKKSGERGYVQIVENKRDGAAVRQRVIANLGRADELAASGALASLIASGAKLADQVLLLDALMRTPKARCRLRPGESAGRCCSAGSGSGSGSTPCWATCSRSGRSSFRSSGRRLSPRCIGCSFRARTATTPRGWRITTFPVPRGSSCITSIARWPWLGEKLEEKPDGALVPDLPPAPSRHACLARDHEYVRHGTLSLLAGIDLLTGVVHASVEERHRSREFGTFLQKLDAGYPPSTAIKLILDNHSAHVSKETKAWLAAQPRGRFSFVFTPKHGSWLNLVEGFFSKLARSVLRHIRVASRQELKERILAAISDINRDPVVHTWTYRLNEAA